MGLRQSILLKEGQSHELYELFRSPGVTQAKKLQHYAALKQVWNAVSVPEGICGFGRDSVFIDRATEELIGLQNLQTFGELSAPRLASVRSEPDLLALLPRGLSAPDLNVLMTTSTPTLPVCSKSIA
jgi:hypothetical protein